MEGPLPITQPNGELPARMPQAPERFEGRPGAAITNPEPSIHKGIELSALPEAAIEGTELVEEFGVVHVTGRDATRAECLRLMQMRRPFVHLGVHGVAGDSWDSGALVFAAHDGQENSSDETNLLTMQSLLGAHLMTRMISLASCWTARPDQILPDEMINFPAVCLLAGAETVIAPLWPVEDDVAHLFVTTFYRRWLGSGATSVQAFLQAVETSAAFDPSSTSPAAFVLYGK